MKNAIHNVIDSTNKAVASHKEVVEGALSVLDAAVKEFPKDKEVQELSSTVGSDLRALNSLLNKFDLKGTKEEVVVP